ncbi:hypothetical protein CDV55_100474 [Aspergillus turcosus]|nr:hypothetical protein CDV55_100474 [Aspergillus turcosus]
MVKATRTFQCQRCSRTFARLEHLQRHDRSHTKEKPYICDKCPKSFTRKDLLTRHERLSHSSPSGKRDAENGDHPTPPSSTDHVLDGLNILASAVADHSLPTPTPPRGPHQHPLSAGQGSFSSGLAGSADQTPLASHPLQSTHSSGTAEATVFGEPFSGYTTSNAYDGDDFTSFLDSIPLPSHPYSPTYQPLPVFPTWHFDSTSDYDHSVERTGAAEAAATPSSLVLPRHGTQLPSLQPESPQTSHRARQPKGAIFVTAQCRDRIVTLLADYANVLTDPYIPSRHALSRCLTGYLSGYHDHYPFMHIPTLEIENVSLQLFLSMAALGARYCREPDTSLSLYQIARTVTMEHVRRTYQFPGSGHFSEKFRLSTTGTPESQDLLETIQALLLLHSVSSWFKRDPPHHESLFIRSFMESMLRMGGLNDLPEHDGSWESWIRRECVKRTSLIVFCYINILTIVFDITPLILTEEISMDLPCSEKEWHATSAVAWMQERSQTPPEPKLQDALSSLFTHPTTPKANLESFSSLGGYVLIHAILQDIWLLQKARRLPLSRNSSLSTAEALSLEQALEQWCQCWERNQESSTDPFNPHGPLSFTSTALLRLAYIRLNADFTSARRLHTWDPSQIAQSLRQNLSVQRGDRLTRAALHCAHALSTPIKLGINYVAHTLVTTWSNQYALCSLECAVLLAKWLEKVTVPNPDPALTEQETKLLEFVIEMVMETQHGASREWLLENNTRLSALVTRLWGRLFTTDHIWEVVNLIGQSLSRPKQLTDGKFDAASTYLDGVKDFQSSLAAVQNALSPKDTGLGIFWHPYPNSWCLTGSTQNPNVNENEEGLIPDFAIPSGISGWTDLVKGGRLKEKNLRNLGELKKNGCHLTEDGYMHTFDKRVEDDRWSSPGEYGRRTDVDSDWNPARAHLTFDFTNVKQDKKEGKLNSTSIACRAQLDGFLESRSTFRSQAILEAKAQRRKDHEPNVTWQETTMLEALTSNTTIEHSIDGYAEKSVSRGPTLQDTYRWYDKAVTPFGFGLHYTTFDITWPRKALGPYNTAALVKRAPKNTPVDMASFDTFRIQVTNTGKTTSDYVALLFLKTTDAGPKPYPLKTLVGYTRAKQIKPGEKRAVEIAVTLGSLARTAENGDLVLYPGQYTLEVDVERANIPLLVSRLKAKRRFWTTFPSLLRLGDVGFPGQYYYQNMTCHVVGTLPSADLKLDAYATVGKDYARVLAGANLQGD